MATIHFTSSESLLEHDLQAGDHAEITVTDYLEGTYGELRDGRDGRGDTIALYKNGAWELPDGRRFSDWAIKV